MSKLSLYYICINVLTILCMPRQLYCRDMSRHYCDSKETRYKQNAVASNLHFKLVNHEWNAFSISFSLILFYALHNSLLSRRLPPDLSRQAATTVSIYYYKLLVLFCMYTLGVSPLKFLCNANVSYAKPEGDAMHARYTYLTTICVLTLPNSINKIL